MPSRDDSHIYPSPSHPVSSSSPSSSTPQPPQPHLLSALVAQTSSSTTTTTSSSQDTLDLLQTTQRLIDSLSEFGSSVSLRVEGIERSLARLRGTLADIRASQENRIAPPSRRRPADQAPTQTGNMSRLAAYASEPVIDGPLSTRARPGLPNPAIESTEYIWALKNSHFPRAVYGPGSPPPMPVQGSLMDEYQWGYIDIYDVWQSGTEAKWPLPTDPRRTALLPRTIPSAPARVGSGQWKALHVLAYRLEDLTTAWTNRGHLITLPHPFISFTERHMLDIGRALFAYQVFSTPSRPASEGNKALVELYQSCAAAYISLFASILSEGFCDNPSAMFHMSRNAKVDCKNRTVRDECVLHVEKTLNCFNVAGFYVSPPEVSLPKDHPMRVAWRKREWRLMPGVSRSMEQDQIRKVLDEVDRQVYNIEAGRGLRPTNLRDQANAPRPMVVSSKRSDRPAPSLPRSLPLRPPTPDYLSPDLYWPDFDRDPGTLLPGFTASDLEAFLGQLHDAHPLPPSGPSPSRPAPARPAAVVPEQSLTQLGALVEERLEAMSSETPPAPTAAPPEPHSFTAVSIAEMLHEPPPATTRTTVRHGQEDPRWARRTADAIADVAREVADRTAYHDRAEFRERAPLGPPAPLRIPALDLRATFDPGPSPSSPTVAGTPTLELMNQIQRRANAARAAVASGGNAGAAPTSRAALRAEYQASLATMRAFVAELGPVPAVPIPLPNTANRSSGPPNPVDPRVPSPVHRESTDRELPGLWLPPNGDSGIGSGSEDSDSVEDGDSDEDEDDDVDEDEEDEDADFYGEDDGTASYADSEDDDEDDEDGEEEREQEQQRRVPAMPFLRNWGGSETDDLEVQAYLQHLGRTTGPNQSRSNLSPREQQLLDAFEYSLSAGDSDANRRHLDAMRLSVRHRMARSAGTARASATPTATPGPVPGPSTTGASETETETRLSRLNTGDGRMWADPYSTASEELDRLPIYPLDPSTDREFLAQVAQLRRETTPSWNREIPGRRAETGNDDK